MCHVNWDDTNDGEKNFIQKWILHISLISQHQTTLYLRIDE